MNAALLGEPGHVRRVLDLVIAQEDGDWAKSGEIATRLGAERVHVRVPPLCMDAVARGRHPPPTHPDRAAARAPGARILVRPAGTASGDFPLTVGL